MAVDQATDAGGRIRVLILCSGLDVQRQIDNRLLGLLRRVSRQGAMVGAVCTGAYALARAGLLNNRRSTIHWENLGGFSEAFPEIETSADLFEIDRDRFTCSGGTAALDMMLHLIGRQHGPKLATDVSEQVIHDRIREPHSYQRMELRTRLDVNRTRHAAKGRVQHAAAATRPIAPAAVDLDLRSDITHSHTIFGGGACP